MNRVIINELKLKTLKNRLRKIRVMLPIDYEESEKDYPVLYMMDGQNLIDISIFSGYSWDVINTMDQLHDLTKGVIIVGIDAHEKKRILEYSPYISKKMEKYIHKIVKLPVNEIKPEADEFGEFIVNQLKPMIDFEYRTKKSKEYTFIAGSSCGGVISIYLGLKYQKVFSVIGAFSPAYRFLAPNMENYINCIDIIEDTRIYHDMGKKENGIMSFTYLMAQNRFHQAILKKMDKSRILKIAQEKALHNERFWAFRFRDFLKFCIRK